MHRAILAALLLAGACLAQRPDGLYAEIKTTKGVIVARLEPDLTPITVANFVGLAEGTIANAAFDPGRPYFDGVVYHRVVPGHVIQAGIPQSDRAKSPGYTIPNEIHARLSHNHAGAMNMANAGPNTGASQFCFTLSDRSYLDGNYTVFGDVVEGLDVVMRIQQGDVMESVRILRVGAKAQAFHPTEESFRAQLKAAQARVAVHAEKKRQAQAEWVARIYPKAGGPAGGVLTQRLAEGSPGPPGAPLRVRYTGRQLRYVGDVIGREGPPLQITAFVSDAAGLPGFGDTAQEFVFDPAKTKINAAMDAALAAMQPGERRVLIVPNAYGRTGYTAPDVPGKRRFALSPETMLAYEIEALPAR
jgi:cyclophilin family peptidyl-prolyl cis-trans isomerase